MGSVDSPLDKLVEQLRLWHGGLRTEPGHFTGWSLGARFYPVLYMLTRMGGAQDWGTGLPLKRGLLGRMNQLEVHHIFPKSRLYQKGYNRSEVNALANFCFLTKDTNLQISDRFPEEYFQEVDSKHPGVLESQWVPIDPELRRIENYLDFLAERRRLQYWIPASQVAPVIPDGRGYAIGFRDIARPTDARTAIVALVPWAGYGNTVPLLIGGEEALSAELAATAAANLNCLCLDFIVRQKAQGTHLNWYIVEQLPVVADGDYDRRFGNTTARDLVRDHVLRLTYTAHDMAPFARDLGYDGPPFTWDEEERRHLRARLDALYFHLYGLSREDAGYVLDTFPIVRRQDEAAFGSYRTRDLILAYMNAFAAGDTDTVVSV